MFADKRSANIFGNCVDCGSSVCGFSVLWWSKIIPPQKKSQAVGLWLAAAFLTSTHLHHKLRRVRREGRFRTFLLPV